MIVTQKRTTVEGREEIEKELVKKQGTFLGFPVASWEEVSQSHVGNEIYIETTREIRQVFLNGKALLHS